jgi:hypothetical protein
MGNEEESPTLAKPARMGHPKAAFGLNGQRNISEYLYPSIYMIKL